jgi:anti-sigma B factor antagonist
VNPTSRSEALKIELADGARGARIIKLKGQLTLQTLFEFQTAARQEAAKSLVIDISGVPYMDSAGLGCLISVFASCQRTNRGFAIIGVTDRIRTLFEVTHVDGLLPCFSSLDAAEAAVMKTST